jgi:hypothetical protein
VASGRAPACSQHQKLDHGLDSAPYLVSARATKSTLNPLQFHPSETAIISRHCGTESDREVMDDSSLPTSARQKHISDCDQGRGDSATVSSHAQTAAAVLFCAPMRVLAAVVLPPTGPARPRGGHCAEVIADLSTRREACPLKHGHRYATGRTSRNTWPWTRFSTSGGSETSTSPASWHRSMPRAVRRACGVLILAR